jgi:hypothetical protein
VVWDPPSHLGYVILSGIPVRNYRADIELQELEDNAVDEGGSVTTVIHWSATFDAKLPGTGALLRSGLRAMIARFAKRAAQRAEQQSASSAG